jgi:hypothetical protein
MPAARGESCSSSGTRERLHASNARRELQCRQHDGHAACQQPERKAAVSVVRWLHASSTRGELQRQQQEGQAACQQHEGRVAAEVSGGLQCRQHGSSAALTVAR